jgi:hypothetical protein
MKDTIRQYTNLFAVLAALTVNVLATTLPLNGLNTGEISDRFRVYFVPAGYVFSIWGVIYVGWIAFVIFQMRRAQKSSPRMRALGYLFALSCLFNAIWLFCWHYEYFGLSVLVMLALLATLIAAYLRLNVCRVNVGAVERWSVDIPFSAYLGWISVAAVANIADFLYYVGWDGLGIAPQVWAVIMLAVACLLGLGMALTRRDSAYLLVLVWAFVGIAVKQASELLVAAAAGLSALFGLVLIIWSLARSRA